MNSAGTDTDAGARKSPTWKIWVPILVGGLILTKVFGGSDHSAQHCVASSDDGTFATLYNKCDQAIRARVCTAHVAAERFLGLRPVCRVETYRSGGTIASGASSQGGLGWQIIGGMRHTWEACEADYYPVAVADKPNTYLCKKSAGPALAF